MNIIDILVEQCRKPVGILGKIMTKTMNVMDAGLTKWVIEKVENGHVLDIGCGGGKTIYNLSKKNLAKSIYGIDYSEEAVKLAIKKNHILIKNGTVNIQQGDVTEIPFKREYFDYVLAVRTHYFWNHLEKAFEEIYRVLNKDGKFLILSEMYKIQYHMKEYDTDESIRKLLNQVGFRSVLIEKRDKSLCITAIK